MGIAYTPAEREQMVGNLEGQIALAIARRKVRFDNSMPMASRFDPRLPNFRMPAPQVRRDFRTDAVRPLPTMRRTSPSRRLGSSRPGLRAGALTSRRLTEIYLSRIDALGPKLECFAAVAPERALAEADAADALLRGGVNLGPLHGIPYGLKDLFDTKGIVTGWGAEPFRDRVPDRGRDDRAQAARGRRGASGQDHRRGARLQRHLVRRLDAQSLEPQRRLERFERRLGFRHRRRPVRLLDRHRDAGVDHLAQPALRHDRAATDLRPRLARRRHGALLVARQGGADLPLGRGHRDGAGRAQRRRRRRPLLDRRAVQLRRRGRYFRRSGSAIFRKPSAKARPRSIMRRSRRAGVSASRWSRFRCPTFPTRR